MQTCRCHALLRCYHFLSALAGTQCVDWLKNLSEPDILENSKVTIQRPQWQHVGSTGGCPNFIVFCTHSCRPLSSLASCLVGGAVTSSCAFSCSMHSYRPLSSLASCLVRGAITSSCAFSWASLYTPVQKINKRKVFAKALAALKQGVGKQSFSETNYRGGRWPSGRKSRGEVEEAIAQNNKLSGLPLDSAHIDGLSALYIHENLRIDMVMDAFVRYMAFVKDKIHPNKPYVDTSWFTKKWRNWGQKLARSLVLYCRGCFQHRLFQETKVDLMQNLMNMLKQSIILRSKENDAQW